ncbi:hypothetical protein BU16DRAFT_559103 [Lophium mytilinum]|uniref:Fido domain-containing protein n=1 Tax=Lophium mytilinum TaxID=390894 RepID=A0A6A6QZ28_9PEZI|nr:hypothetical protein BU16DRAFT_559103 [Lophium mytilinum]
MTFDVAKFRFLTAAQVIRLHRSIIMNAQPTQPSMLESAVQSPININYYTTQQNMFQLAAKLSEKIMKNHAFQDGNKRTALLAAYMFLRINGYKLQSAPLQSNTVNGSLANAQVAVCTNAWTAEQLGQFYQQTSTAIERPCYAATTRACHTATAEFTDLGPDDTLVTKDISIGVSDPGEAYVLIPTEVGYALPVGNCLTSSSSALPKPPGRLRLMYYHDTQHFALDSSPVCPRLVIPQQLPRQSTAKTSPATLYPYGEMHTIALDGTPDAEFAHLASTVEQEIGDALDQLKDM